MTSSVACSDREQRAASWHSPVAFTVAGQAFSIDLPIGAENRPPPASDAVARLQLAPGRRSSPTISIYNGADGLPSFPYDREVGVPAGKLMFGTSRVSGGSGGPEAVLDGVLETPAGRYRVSCWIQGEWPGEPNRGDAGWCLPYLKTLRLRADGAETCPS